MNSLPAERRQEPRVVEAEVVGHEPAPSLGRSVLSRLAVGFTFALIGIAMVVAGVLLTVTIIGALIGIPLAIMGLLLIVVAVAAPFARGRVQFVSFGRHGVNLQP
jgi:uncharacterized membrane protein YccF (DUF307 family)